MSKRKINKKKVAIASVVAVTSLGVATIYFNSQLHFKLKLIRKGIEISSDAVYGTIDVEKKGTDFSLVRCGNYNIGLNSNAKRLLEDTKIPTGIIIESKATNYAEIYKDVDYAKEIVATYSVEYPVCLDVSSLMSVKNPDIDDINVMVDAFVKKMNANGCVTYIIGDDNTMTSLLNEKKVTDIISSAEPVSYKTGLIADSYFPKVDISYDMVIGNKYIYMDTNCKKYKNGEYNKKELFYDDWVHYIKEGETLEDLAYIYEYSVKNIKITNELESDIIFEDQKIVIPSKYHAPYNKGVDISQYQGEIDFDLLAERLKSNDNNGFALLRCGYSTSEEVDDPQIVDKYFNHNIVNLTSRGIDVGVYYFSRATTIKEVDDEINNLLLQIEGRDITLPVYIDIEGEALKRLASKNEKEHNIELSIIKRFISSIKEAGYMPGIYIHVNSKDLVKCFEDECSIWVNGGYYYNVEQTFDNMYFPNELEGVADVFQVSQKGIGDYFGIQGNEYVDINYSINEYGKNKTYTYK